MNAIRREACEASVLTDEAIEVHLSYLRPAVEALQTEVPELRKEIRALDDKLCAKIDAQSEKSDQQYRELSGKIDSYYNKLNGKIDSHYRELCRKIDSRYVELNGKIDYQGERLDAKIDAQGARLEQKFDIQNDKIDKLSERLLEMQGNQKGLVLFLSICGLLVSGVSIARTLNWI